MKTVSPERARTGCLVLGVFKSNNGEKPDMTDAALTADRASRGALRAVLAAGDLSGRNGSTLLLRNVPGLAAERVLLVGLGPRSEFGDSAYRDALRSAANALKQTGATDACFYFAEIKVGPHGQEWNVRHAVLVLRDVGYRFEHLKSKKSSPPERLAKVSLCLSGAPASADLQAALREAVATADGVDLARTLGNLPSNICTPTYLAEQARKIARQHKLGVEILERRDMEKLGMGALLSVTKGTVEPPKLIVLRHNGAAKTRKPLVLVGKGITFDTGGISLKPGAEMDEMKYDMSGAASVLGTLQALAAMRAPVNVIGVIPTCENMPSATATKPGDIVTTMSGQTVEILNTDAEGRLILCDAMTYVERFKPDAVIDIATLTGACVIALGHIVSGLFANDDALAEGIKSAGDDAWDRVWRLPLHDDYQEQLRSNFADMANIGGRPAGSITAACYLSRFAKKYRWAHLDIAGTAWKSGRDKGSTGRPVPLLVRFALQHAGKR